MIKRLLLLLLSYSVGLTAALEARPFPLHTAVNSADMETVMHIITTAERDKTVIVNEQNEEGKRPLDMIFGIHKTRLATAPDIMAALLTAGATPTVYQNETMLHRLVKEWSPDEDHSIAYETMLEKIVPHCATTVDTLNSSGFNALHLACTYGAVQLVKTLLAHGANANATTHDQRRPLHCVLDCIRPQHTIDLLTTLLEAGADIRSADVACKGSRPLCIQYEFSRNRGPRDIAVFKRLTDAGADINALNCKGLTLLDLLTLPEMENDLKKLGAQTKDELTRPER